MSGTPPSFDPYRSPENVQQYSQSIPAGRRPGFLTFIAVTAIVLGALGYITILLGATELLFGKKIQGAISSMNADVMNDETKKIQEQMVGEVDSLSNKYYWPNLIILLVHIPLTTLMLIGGIKTMGIQPSGRSILSLTFAAAAAFIVVRGIVQFQVLMETSAIMNEYMQKIFAAQIPAGQFPAGQGKEIVEAQKTAMQTGIKMGMIGGAVIMIFLLLVKLVYFLVSFRYLNKETIRELYEPPVTAKLI